MSPVPSGLDPARIEARIRAYEGFGTHRTGWPGDDRATDWLLKELRAAGVSAESERFAFPRVEVQRARVTWSDGSIDGEPMYDGGFTRIGGVTGDIGEDNDPEPFGKVLIATSAIRSDDRWSARDVRAHYTGFQQQGVLGIVVPTGGPDSNLLLRNAEHIRQPFGLPVLQVAKKDARRLTSALLMGGEATIEIDGDRLNSRATNVVATLPGTDATAAPLVVMTPKSGWFTCAAERGGGLAIWLALAEALAALPEQRRTVHLLASSGHELHQAGIEEFTKKRGALPKGAHAWLDLGSSIGAKDGTTRVAASDDELLGVATSAVAAAGIEGYEALPVGEHGGSEARTIALYKGRYVTFSGSHPYLHSAQDAFDRTCDPATIASWGAAMWAVLTGLMG